MKMSSPRASFSTRCAIRVSASDFQGSKRQWIAIEPRIVRLRAELLQDMQHRVAALGDHVFSLARAAGDGQRAGEARVAGWIP